MTKIGSQTERIIALLDQVLQVNPGDCPSITTLVVNQTMCPRPPTLLSRWPLVSNIEITARTYYVIVTWLIDENEAQDNAWHAWLLDMYFAHSGR